MAALLALLFLLVPSPALAGWVVAESANFRLFAQEPAAEAAARVAELEDFRALLVRMTGRAPPAGLPRLEVYLVPDLASAVPGQRVPPGVAGFYRATAGGIAAFVSAAAGPEAARATLFHEYAHHFMFAETRVAYPAWYVEGFAEYVMTARLAPRSLAFGHPDAARLRRLDAGGWLPPEELLRGAQDPRDLRRASMFYAQSWLLTHWLFRTRGGPEKLRAYLARTARGEDLVEAFRVEVLPDLEQLNPRLLAYRQNRRAFAYFRVKRDPPAPVEVRVTELAPAADRLLLPVVALTHGVDPTTGAALLAMIRAAAEAAPDDAYAARALALAEIQQGDPARALPLLDGLLARAPADPDLLRWRGVGLLRAGGSPAEARAMFARALAADPSDWRALVARADSLPRGAADAERWAAIGEAWALAPQVSTNILAHALALAEADRMAEAAAVLQPLAWSPHGGPMARTAQRLGALAMTGDRAAFLAAFDIVAVRGEAAHAGQAR